MRWSVLIHGQIPSSGSSDEPSEFFDGTKAGKPSTDSALPLGIPQLMMGFTEDGQLKPEMIQSRDKELGISTAKERKDRQDLTQSAPPVQPGADGWQSGQAPQLVLNKIPLKNKRG